MKTRQGFISNSSSSSFIIKGSGIYPSIVEVAKAMIKIRDEDWERPSTLAKKLDKHAKTVDFRKVGIFFTSCNYDTFIYEVDGYFIIKTCNNHPFYDAFDAYSYVPEQLCEKLKDYGIYDIDSIEYRNPNIDFVNLEANFIGKILNRDYLCQEHGYSETWMLKRADNSYVFYCPSCKKQINLENQKDKLYFIKIITDNAPSCKIEFLIKGREDVLKLKQHYPTYYIREQEYDIPEILTLEEAIEKLK
jgi:hypothetical protein